jgi:hypothetical protein
MKNLPQKELTEQDKALKELIEKDEETRQAYLNRLFVLENDIELRKYCIELTYGHMNNVSGRMKSKAIKDPIAEAERIYRWLTIGLRHANNIES